MLYTKPAHNRPGGYNREEGEDKESGEFGAEHIMSKERS
jgi:hypothetical protein